MKKVSLLLILITSIALFSNETYDKALIKEYYNLLETEGTCNDTYNMTNWDINFETYKNKYQNVESIQLEPIQMIKDNIYEVNLYLKEYNKDPLFYKAKIVMETIEGKYRGIKKIDTSLQDKFLNEDQLLITKYYEYMERTTTLDKAYNLAKKDYSFEKFNSWYAYNRAYIDIEYIESKDSIIRYEDLNSTYHYKHHSYIVNFEEDYLGERLYFKYLVELTTHDSIIVNSTSKKVDVPKKNYQFIFIEDKIVCGNIMSRQEVDKFITGFDARFDRSEYVAMQDIYRFYKYCDFKDLIKGYLNKKIINESKHYFTGILLSFYNFEFLDHNKVGTLKLLIDSGMDQNYRSFEPGSFDFLPINIAIRNNNMFAVKYILSKGIDKSTNALYDSLLIDRLDIFKLLLENGISIDQPLNQSKHREDYYISTSICYAIYNNDIDLLLYLIDRGADLNKVVYYSQGLHYTLEEYEFNPTAYAIYLERYDILKLLLLYGADEPKGYRKKHYTFGYEQDNELKLSMLEGIREYYPWDVHPSINTNIYTKEGKYFIETKITDLYTAAKLSNETSALEILDSNNIKPNPVNILKEIKLKE